MLQISNFKKYYNGNLALDIPELHLDKGIYWIKGSNGSGKTTFFRCISGILPFEGSIKLFDIDPVKEAVKYRFNVNYGEAEPLYPSFLTANDIITFTAKARKASSEQVNALVDAFNIGSFINHATGTYSSGMLKKTSLILAFLGNPRLIILDEPLVTIDDSSVNTVCGLINEYYKSKEVNFLISSHQHIHFDHLPVKNSYLVADKTVSPFLIPANNEYA